MREACFFEHRVLIAWKRAGTGINSPTIQLQLARRVSRSCQTAPNSQLCDNVAEDVSVVAAVLRQDALDPSQCVSRWRVRPEPSAFAVLQMCAIGTEHALLHVYVVVAAEKPQNRIHCAVSPACSACWNCQSSLLHVLVSAVLPMRIRRPAAEQLPADELFRSRLVAPDARTAITFGLRPGNARGAPAGCALLEH